MQDGGTREKGGVVVGSQRKRRWQQGREEKGWSTAKRGRVKGVTASHGEQRKERKKKGRKKTDVSKTTLGWGLLG